MIDYKNFQFLSKNIRLLNDNFEQKELEVLLKNIFDIENSIDLENLFRDIHSLNILKFAKFWFKK